MKADPAIQNQGNLLLMELMLGFIQGTLDTFLSLLKAVVNGEFKNVEFSDKDKDQTYRYIEQLQQIMDEQTTILQRREKLPLSLNRTEKQLFSLLKDKKHFSAEEETTLETMAAILKLIKSDDKK